MPTERGKYVWALLYGLLLFAFTVYLALDTFVITRVYAIVETDAAPGNADSINSANNANTASGAEEAAPTSQSTEQAELIITANSYQDENISITLTEYRRDDTTVYVADIILSSAAYLQTALAGNVYGRNISAKTSEIASDAGAILAVNGDYYGSRESGYVIRNGVLYRDSAAKGQTDLVIYMDGSFAIIDEAEISAAELLEDGAAQVFSFGPALVEAGEITVEAGAEVDRAMSANPRTAIGIIDGLHYLFVVADGRTQASAGLTLYHLAQFMQSLGAELAYNLDGGGSSTMVFNGEVINNPTTSGSSIKERSVSDIVYIGY